MNHQGILVVVSGFSGAGKKLAVRESTAKKAAKAAFFAIRRERRQEASGMRAPVEVLILL